MPPKSRAPSTCPRRATRPPPRTAAPGPRRPRRSTKPSSAATSSPSSQKKGADGYACVNCHATHTLFDGTWSTVKNVVDRRDPENSLLLRKPTSTAESEGVANARPPRTEAASAGRKARPNTRRSSSGLRASRTASWPVLLQKNYPIVSTTRKRALPFIMRS